GRDAGLRGRLPRVGRVGLAERAQDEFGVEVLTRLQGLRGDERERRRLARGDLDERGDLERLVVVGARLRVNRSRLSGEDYSLPYTHWRWSHSQPGESGGPPK